MECVAVKVKAVSQVSGIAETYQGKYKISLTINTQSSMCICMKHIIKKNKHKEK